MRRSSEITDSRWHVLLCKQVKQKESYDFPALTREHTLLSCPLPLGDKNKKKTQMNWREKNLPPSLILLTNPCTSLLLWNEIRIKKKYNTESCRLLHLKFNERNSWLLIQGLELWRKVCIALLQDPLLFIDRHFCACHDSLPRQLFLKLNFSPAPCFTSPPGITIVSDSIFDFRKIKHLHGLRQNLSIQNETILHIIKIKVSLLFKYKYLLNFVFPTKSLRENECWWEKY